MSATLRAAAGRLFNYLGVNRTQRPGVGALGHGLQIGVGQGLGHGLKKAETRLAPFR